MRLLPILHFIETECQLAIPGRFRGGSGSVDLAQVHQALALHLLRLSLALEVQRVTLADLGSCAGARLKISLRLLKVVVIFILNGSITAFLRRRPMALGAVSGLAALVPRRPNFLIVKVHGSSLGQVMYS